MQKVLVFGALAVFATGCDVFNFDINDQRARAEFSVQSEANSWTSTVQVRPNDLEEIRDNKDKLQEATVTAVRLNILATDPANQATTGAVKGWVRTIGGEYPDEYDWDIQDFELVAGTTGNPDNSMPNNNNEQLAVDQDKLDRIRDLIFPGEGQVNDIEIELTIEADGPPNFVAEVIVEFDAVANPF